MFYTLCDKLVPPNCKVDTITVTILPANNKLNPEESQLCDLLASIIDRELTEAQNKIWHAHPVWFINENPIVGYSKQKAGIRLMFWSGKDFEEEKANEKPDPILVEQYTTIIKEYKMNTVDNYNFAGKRALVRVDFNVPLDKATLAVTDDARRKTIDRADAAQMFGSTIYAQTVVLAVFMVYIVMASQFESLLHPFVILFTIPLAMVGAVLALWLSNSTVSVVVFIGLILLVGIVVKNAIMLIDKINQLREQGTAKFEAICKGSESRLRPIIMTTMTTLFGFAPLAFFGGDGAEVRAPMALTVIGGLLVSTLLTLVVIPVVYNLLDRKSDEYYRARGKLQAHAETAEATP